MGQYLDDQTEATTNDPTSILYVEVDPGTGFAPRKIQAQNLLAGGASRVDGTASASV